MAELITTESIKIDGLFGFMLMLLKLSHLNKKNKTTMSFFGWFSGLRSRSWNFREQVISNILSNSIEQRSTLYRNIVSLSISLSVIFPIITQKVLPKKKNPKRIIKIQQAAFPVLSPNLHTTIESLQSYFSHSFHFPSSIF